MFFINVTSPLTLILVLLATVLVIFLAQEVKKSSVAILPLVAHLALLITHTIQMLTLPSEYSYLHGSFVGCLAIDFILVLVSFFAYLWVDDIEAKAMNKKSLDNSLDWFWKKI